MRSLYFLKLLAVFWLFLFEIGARTPLYGQDYLNLSYSGGLERMAEILGSLHYLDNLCHDPTKGDTSQEWRYFMDTILVTQTPDSIIRARLVGAFNRSFRAFSENYYQCTAAAKTAAQIYRQEGQKLSQELVNRYGR